MICGVNATGKIELIVFIWYGIQFIFHSQIGLDWVGAMAKKEEIIVLIQKLFNNVRMNVFPFVVEFLGTKFYKCGCSAG